VGVVQMTLRKSVTGMCAVVWWPGYMEVFEIRRPTLRLHQKTS